jgi:hypothetical protein
VKRPSLQDDGHREIPGFRLEDAKWKKLAAKYNLPEAARSEIEETISLYKFYRTWEVEGLPPKEVRRSYNEIFRLAEALRSKSSNLRGNEYLLYPMAATFPEGSITAVEFFSVLEGSLTDLIDHVVEALNRLPPATRGPKTVVLKGTILTLDRILKTHGRPGIVAGKHSHSQACKLAAAVCKIADPELREDLIFSTTDAVFSSPDANIKAWGQWLRIIQRIQG